MLVAARLEVGMVRLVEVVLKPGPRACPPLATLGTQLLQLQRGRHSAGLPADLYRPQVPHGPGWPHPPTAACSAAAMNNLVGKHTVDDRLRLTIEPFKRRGLVWRGGLNVLSAHRTGLQMVCRRHEASENGPRILRRTVRMPCGERRRSSATRRHAMVTPLPIWLCSRGQQVRCIIK